MTVTLDDIARGDARPAEARVALAGILAKLTPETAQQVYTALRAWVWKALNGRRRDQELREWFDLLKRIGAYLAREHKTQSERLRVLHELIYESISVSEVLPLRDVLKRRHVREVLVLLCEAPIGQLSRAQIAARLRLAGC
jgi:hypothetical protein